MNLKGKISVLVVALILLAQPVSAAQNIGFKTAEEFNLSAKKEKIGEYSTSFNPDAIARAHNMKLASIAIDQYVIQPGATFSFNEAVGYASQERGYMEATIFVNGKKDKGFGGGICQISSTLYNAGMAAGLEIVERHPHSRPVGYVPKGKDAAASYGGVDLKMKNNFSYPVTINTYIMNNDTFTAEILK